MTSHIFKAKAALSLLLTTFIMTATIVSLSLPHAHADSEQLTASTIKMKIAKFANNPQRDPVHLDRNQYRNPVRTLDFLGLKPDMTVVEIWPGKGWYTEILAPIVRDHGRLYAAHFPKESSIPFYRKMYQSFEQKMAKAPTLFDQVQLIQFNPPTTDISIPMASVDMVLTFRNVHNWIKSDREETFFKAFYDMLKPGGILGVVEHRGTKEMTQKQMAQSGYVPESYVIDLAKAVGFKLVARSEFNANPKDLKAYPKGVWTLPPTLRLKEKNREKYLAIGESDRMTLKFIKKR